MKKNRGLQSSDPIQSNPQSFLKILTQSNPIQSNPIQSNPWMDPIHVQLWGKVVGHFAQFDFSLSLDTCIAVPLSEIYCTYHVTDSTLAAAGLLPLLVGPPGTVSRTLSATELHRSCFQAPAKDTVLSPCALGFFFRRCAIQIYT